jgi:hypothetical protein
VRRHIAPGTANVPLTLSQDDPSDS